MAKVPVIEEQQLQDVISIAAVTGQSSARDAALLALLEYSVVARDRSRPKIRH
jgi:hypothetical protein